MITRDTGGQLSRTSGNAATATYISIYQFTGLNIRKLYVQILWLLANTMHHATARIAVLASILVVIVSRAASRLWLAAEIGDVGLALDFVTFDDGTVYKLSSKRLNPHNAATSCLPDC